MKNLVEMHWEKQLSIILLLRTAGADSITTEDQTKKNRMSSNTTNATVIPTSAEGKLY